MITIIVFDLVLLSVSSSVAKYVCFSLLSFVYVLPVLCFPNMFVRVFSLLYSLLFAAWVLVLLST